MQQNLKTVALIIAGFFLLLLVTAFIDLGAGTKENSKSVAAGGALQKSATEIEDLKPNVEMDKDLVNIKTALLANGCFWCAEADLEKVPGVISVVSGYAGGTGQNPTYENHAALGHREVVLVTYDESKVTFANLVEFTIKNGDPTDSEGSFNDRGPQYVPAIYVESEEEREVAGKIISAVDALQVFSSPLPLSVLPRAEFWPAEEYHQNFAEKNPLKYGYYRVASGRTAFIKKYWGEESAKFTFSAQPEAGALNTFTENSWDNFKKPTAAVLRSSLTPIQYKVTQEDGTERPFENVYDTNEEPGIYIDIVSGEPLFLSIDKYDSGTGWPSFVKPIKEEVVTLHEDNTLFSTRTEVRSRFADSHLGHVFEDGPNDRGGLRYCMNSAALRFIAQADMEQEGYGYLLLLLK